MHIPKGLVKGKTGTGNKNKPPLQRKEAIVVRWQWTFQIVGSKRVDANHWNFWETRKKDLITWFANLVQGWIWADSKQGWAYLIS